MGFFDSISAGVDAAAGIFDRLTPLLTSTGVLDPGPPEQIFVQAPQPMMQPQPVGSAIPLPQPGAPMPGAGGNVQNVSFLPALGTALRNPTVQRALVGGLTALSILDVGEDDLEDFVEVSVNPETGERRERFAATKTLTNDGKSTTYRNVGKPLLYSGDLRIAEKVAKDLERIESAVGRLKGKRPRRVTHSHRHTHGRKKTARKRRTSKQTKAQRAFAAASRKYGGKIPKGTDLGRPGPRI